MANAKRLLLIEDDTVLGRLLSRVLEEAGYTVVWATDGIAGIRLLEAGDVDLVITDLHLPGRDGFAVLQAATALGSAPPVLLITGGTSVLDVHMAVEAGAVDYLFKPFRIDEFLSRINVCLERHWPAPADAVGLG